MFYTAGELDSSADLLLCKKNENVVHRVDLHFFPAVGSCGEAVVLFGNICFGATTENDLRINFLALDHFKRPLIFGRTDVTTKSI